MATDEVDSQRCAASRVSQAASTKATATTPIECNAPPRRSNGNDATAPSIALRYVCGVEQAGALGRALQQKCLGVAGGDERNHLQQHEQCDPAPVQLPGITLEGAAALHEAVRDRSARSVQRRRHQVEHRARARRNEHRGGRNEKSARHVVLEAHAARRQRAADSETEQGDGEHRECQVRKQLDRHHAGQEDFEEHGRRAEHGDRQ